MTSYLISGSSRGLGLALVAELAAKPASEVSKVFAAVRTETNEVKQLAIDHRGRVELISMDANLEDSIRAAVAKVEQSLGGQGLDVLINVAGMSSVAMGGIEQMDDLMSLFNVNVMGAHQVTRAYLPLLRKGNAKKIANISTTVGSITMAPTFREIPTPAYKISKAALNMLTVQYALSLEDQGFTTIAVSPGWIKTPIGGDNADLDVGTAARATLDVIVRSGPDLNGKFLNIHVPGWENSPGLNQYEGGQPAW
ncbi:unnamed protein product [Clonostachys rosea f. rosea IK726]|uniref:Uncharacterized protein n=2 Tax=Bionectria ochroleuca TaxID=29856 RepID=A0A0B7KDH8_BIOOC|nr:unnamed protein product [Clonostachys rosea f. rosea IK726]